MKIAVQVLFFGFLSCTSQVHAQTSCEEVLSNRRLESRINMAAVSSLRDSEENTRVDKQILLTFKNSKNEKPQIVDFDRPDIFEKSTILNELSLVYPRRLIESSLGQPMGISWEGLKELVNFSKPALNLTQYDLEVINLKRGDTVIIEGRKFQLGDFLGRGNTSHVWALEDQPEFVLKIPFASNRLRFLLNAGTRSPKLIFNFIKESVDHLKTHENLRAEVSPSGRWALVARVFGNENGTEYLMRLLKLKTVRNANAPEPITQLTSSDSIIFITDATERMKIFNLFEQMRLRGELVLANGSPEARAVEECYNQLTSSMTSLSSPFSVIEVEGYGRFFMNESAMRQYLFDEHMRAWVKVDSEEGEDVLSMCRRYLVPFAEAPSHSSTPGKTHS